MTSISYLPALVTLSILTLSSVAWAGNTSSNSSSNSSAGVHTQVDTVITDDDGRKFKKRRVVRERYGYRWKRQWRPADDEDD